MAAVRDFDPNADAKQTGFSANIQGASLADLVQMECLTGTQCVVRVTSGDDMGYLYFRSGRVVHAMSSSNVGEAAAFEILGWTSGSFEPCNAGWPDTDSIHTSIQALLLRVAQARDESGRHNLLQFRRSRPDAPARPREEQSSSERARPAPAAAQPAPSTPPPASATAARLQAVRLDRSGALISSRGTGAEDLAPATALAARLAGLVGEAFGLDQLLGIEAVGEQLRTLIVIEEDGNLLGVRTTSEADLRSVRERYRI